MSNILSRDTEDGRGSETNWTSDLLMRAFEVAVEEATSGRSTGSGGDRAVRPFLLVDLGTALSYVRGNRGEATEAVENRVEETLRAKTSDGGGDSDESGRSVLSMLFVLGVVAGIAYVLRKHSGSADELVSEAADRVRETADETAMRSGEAAGRTETATEEVADRVRETGEQAADRVETGSEEVADRVETGSEEVADRVEEVGEQAADQVEGAGETVSNVEEEAAESAEEMADDEDGDE